MRFNQGDQVEIISLGIEGTVLAVAPGGYRVDLGRKVGVWQGPAEQMKPVKLLTTIESLAYDEESAKILKQYGKRPWSAWAYLLLQMVLFVYLACTGAVWLRVIGAALALWTVGIIAATQWLRRAGTRRSRTDLLTVSRIKALCRHPAPIDVDALVASDQTIDRRSFQSGMRNMTHLVTATMEQAAADVEAL